jgi:FkbM family methyltransferase
MKRIILGTHLGQIALAARDTIGIVRAVFSSPEIVGTLANDIIADILVKRLCQPDKSFMDIGAHIGSIISGVIYHCPTANIVAVEPLPGKMAYLRRKFPFVTFFECALGESDGEATFYENTKRSGYSSLIRPHNVNALDYRAIEVTIKKLDTLIISDAIDVMKIDVEGAELGVLRGGERLIAKSRPTIMIESVPPIVNCFGYTKAELWRWFAEREYSVVVPNRVAHDDPGLGQDGFLEGHIYPRRATNYFAIPNERRTEIMHRARCVLKATGAKKPAKVRVTMR